jgi:ABC-2 type transport system ATP-binding protein
MDAIYIENLRKSFGKVQALDGLSMRVEQGTICGFIGPNGAGKTTTLRVLLGLVSKDQGSVRLFREEVVFGREPGRSFGPRRLSYLPQDPVFPERHTGQEVMELVAGLYRMDPRLAKERTDALLEEFHLADARKHSVATYSHGMKQRLGLATCFLPEPELLVLDEPVSSLDPEGRVEVFDLLRRLKGTATVLFSSHILEDVERVCDKLVMIRTGRNVVEGPVEDILSRYASDSLRIVFRPEDVERAERALAAMPWVAGISGHPSEAGSPVGIVYLEVKPSAMEAALDGILVSLVKQGFSVREYGRSKTDLETVFLRLSE